MIQMLQFQLLGEYSLPTSIDEQISNQDAGIQVYGDTGHIVVKSETLASVSVFNLLGQSVYVANNSTENDSVVKVLVR